MGTVLSVNVGVPRPNPWKPTATTGIDKRPVQGPVSVTAPGPKGTGAVGLAGDRAYDVQHHGGDDQAVYAYAREDLDAWERELGRELADGAFGENLTTSGLTVDAAELGEQWRVGTALLEVCGPRIPCVTFAAHMGEPRWIKRFAARERVGAYLRVVEAGVVEPGDPAEVVHRPGHGLTLGLAFRAFTTERERLADLGPVVDVLPERDRAKVTGAVSGR